MKNYSSLVERISGQTVRAWDIHSAAQQARRAGKDVTVLSVGDADFHTPASICQVAIDALLNGDTHYSEVPGRPPLRKALAELHQRKTGQPVSAGNIVVTQGAQNALFGVAQCLIEKGDEILVPEPMYLTYQASIQAPGGVMVSVPAQGANGFHLQVQDVAQRITKKTKAIFFANPCNPTGTVMTRQELQDIAALAMEHDLWVVADEVYSALTFEQPHIYFCSLPGKAERTVSIGSFSKSHSMTGWRLGWAVANAQLSEHLSNLSLCMHYGVASFVQDAGIKAVEQYDEISVQICNIYRRRRDIAFDILKQVAGIECLRPEGGMFVMLNIGDLCAKRHMTSMDFCWKLFEQTGISVLDATAFGPSTNGWLRIGLVLDEPELIKACKKIAAFVEAL